MGRESLTALQEWRSTGSDSSSSQIGRPAYLSKIYEHSNDQQYRTIHVDFYK